MRREPGREAPRRRAAAGVPFATWAAFVALAAGCKAETPATKTVPYADDFERIEFGPDYTRTGGQWIIERGSVYSTGANNAPLFLNVDLPNDFVLEVDVTSETAAVDAKVELMTNGRTHQSGYIFILGGWNNTISCIARLDEHGADRVERRPTGVVGRRTYRWRIEKKGGALRWFIDGQPYLAFDDKQPLEGPGHNRFAFSNWQNQLRFDRLRIWPYDAAPPLAVGTATVGATQIP